MKLDTLARANELAHRLERLKEFASKKIMIPYAQELKADTATVVNGAAISSEDYDYMDDQDVKWLVEALPSLIQSQITELTAALEAL